MSQHPISFASMAGITMLSCTALVFSVATAQARDWYILNQSNTTCVTALSISDDYTSPDAFHTALREEGSIDNLKVTKGESGSVTMVEQTFMVDGTPVNLLWFPNADYCEQVRALAIKKGLLADMNDLK